MSPYYVAWLTVSCENFYSTRKGNQQLPQEAGEDSLNSLASKFELCVQPLSAEIKMSPYMPNCTLERFSRFDAPFGYGQRRCTTESTKTSPCKVVDHDFVPTWSLHKHDWRKDGEIGHCQAFRGVTKEEKGHWSYAVVVLSSADHLYLRSSNWHHWSSCLRRAGQL